MVLPVIRNNPIKSQRMLTTSVLDSIKKKKRNHAAFSVEVITYLESEIIMLHVII
jgi:hypothetical protein